MTALADVAAGTIHAQVEIEAPPEAVFDALTTPAELASWWGSPSTYRTQDWKVELRPGGAWSCSALRADGALLSTVRGQFLIVERPRLLEYTWLPSWENFAPSTIRYELVATPGGTSMRVTHDGFRGRAAACEQHAAGWNQVLAWLTAHLARKPAAGP
jgi:uncharacterized protein YndB with AHSA1/START domain